MPVFDLNHLNYISHICNFWLFGCGTAMIILGIFIWNETHIPHIFELLFIGIGLLEIILSTFGITSKNKFYWFSFFFSILFTIQLIGSILGILNKDRIVDEASDSWAKKSINRDQNLRRMISENVDDAFYSTLILDGILVKTFYFNLMKTLLLFSLSAFV